MKQNIKISEIIEFINSDKFDVTFSVAVSLSDYELNSADKIKKAISKIDSMLDNIKFIKKAKKEINRVIDPDSVFSIEVKYYDSSEVTVKKLFTWNCLNGLEEIAVLAMLYLILNSLEKN